MSLEISANERLSRPFPRFLVLDASSTLPHPAATATATAPAMFPRKRRTLEILARNVGSGGWVGGGGRNSREWEGRPPRLGGISFPWRLPANATLPPYRGRRRRHRRRRVCSCSCAPWFRFRSPPLRPRYPPSSRLELPPTPPGAPSPSAPSLRRSPFASVRTTPYTPRHYAFPPRWWCSSFQLVCDTRYAVNVTSTITVNVVVADAVESKTYRLKCALVFMEKCYAIPTW